MPSLEQGLAQLGAGLGSYLSARQADERWAFIQRKIEAAKGRGLTEQEQRRLRRAWLRSGGADAEGIQALANLRLPPERRPGTPESAERTARLGAGLVRALEAARSPDAVPSELASLPGRAVMPLERATESIVPRGVVPGTPEFARSLELPGMAGLLQERGIPVPEGYVGEAGQVRRPPTLVELGELLSGSRPIAEASPTARLYGLAGGSVKTPLGSVQLPSQAEHDAAAGARKADTRRQRLERRLAELEGEATQEALSPLKVQQYAHMRRQLNPSDRYAGEDASILGVEPHLRPEWGPQVERQAQEHNRTMAMVGGMLTGPELDAQALADLYRADAEAGRFVLSARAHLAEGAGDRVAVERNARIARGLVRGMNEQLPPSELEPFMEDMLNAGASESWASKQVNIAGLAAGEKVLAKRTEAGIQPAWQWKRDRHIAAQRFQKHTMPALLNTMATGQYRTFEGLMTWVDRLFTDEGWDAPQFAEFRQWVVENAAHYWGAYERTAAEAAQRASGGPPVAGPTVTHTSRRALPGLSGAQPTARAMAARRGKKGAAAGEQGSAIRGKSGFMTDPKTGEVKAIEGVAGRITDEYVLVKNLDGSGATKGYRVRGHLVSWARSQAYEETKFQQGLDRMQRAQEAAGARGGEPNTTRRWLQRVNR